MTRGVEDRSGDRLHVLVVGTEAWAIDSVVRGLQGSGHEVVSCPDLTATCTTLDGAGCDLDPALDVVCCVRARPLDRVVRSERAAVCALRRGVPLVLAGSTASSPLAPFAARVVDLDGDVVAACEAVAASGSVVHRPEALDDLEMLVRRGLQPGPPLGFEPIAHPVPVQRDPISG
ncbi:MAG: hypothetical protein KDB35_23490 [Acidimicrobiales bacterium]|nr:hypothetical protein [Acidimicrobiales bacterium]